MPRFGTAIAAMLGTCLFALGCGLSTVENDEESVSTDAQAFLFANGDAPNFFWNNIYNLQRLASAPLIASNGRLAPTPLLDTADGRKLLHYVIGCSLRTGETVTSMSGYSFDGAVGLAQEWSSLKLSSLSSQRWVTACLLQTLNGVGAIVPIHMIGSHVGLADDPSVDVSSFKIPDGTMFGNVLAGQVTAYACVDEGIQKECGAGWSINTSQRICDSSPACGITILPMPCQNYCTYDAAGNPKCTPPGGVVEYAESIATTLTLTGYTSMYRECVQR